MLIPIEIVFLVFVPFVEKMATLRMCAFIKLVFLDKIIELIKIIEKCVLTVVEMVIWLTLVTKSMDTLLGTYPIMVKLVKLIMLLLLMKLFMSILKRHRKIEIFTSLDNNIKCCPNCLGNIPATIQQIQLM